MTEAPGDGTALVTLVRRAAVLILLALTLHWAYAACRVLVYPYEWSTMDGYFVSYAQRLLGGEPIYSSNATAPMGFEYVPGYLLVLGPLNALFGAAVWVERALALACTALIAAIAGHVVRRRTGSVPWGLAAVALCVAPPAVGQWYLVRGLDLLVLVVGLAATYVVAESKTLGPREAVAAAVLYALGFYCKQTIVFPWAAGAAIVFLRARRQLPLYLGLSLGLGLVIGFALQRWSGGWFWDNAFVTTSQNPFSLGRLLGMVTAYMPWVLPLLVAAVVCAGRCGRAVVREPWALYAGACIAAMGLAGKLGAAVVYFLPAHVAIVMWVCQQAPGTLAAIASPRLRLAAWALALLQVVVWLGLPLPTPDAEGAAAAARVLQAVQDRPGRVLVERADSFATLAGRTVEWEAVQLPILHKMRDVPIDGLLEDIREQEYATVLFSGQYFGNVYWLRRTIFTYYEPLDGFQAVPLSFFYGTQAYTLLVPKPKDTLPAEPLIPTPVDADAPERAEGQEV